MSEKTLDIIKGALLLEQRGTALYKSAVEQAKDDAVKEMFQMMVDEEQKHVEILSRQYSLVAKGGDFDTTGMAKVEEETAEIVLSDKLVKSISGSGYESAVISSALELEKRAVEYYSEKEAGATTEEEKKLFSWLVKWEKEHMMMLAKLDNDIKENVWYDNNFWPLD